MAKPLIGARQAELAAHRRELYHAGTAPNPGLESTRRPETIMHVIMLLVMLGMTLLAGCATPTPRYAPPAAFEEQRKHELLDYWRQQDEHQQMLERVVH